MNGLVAALAGLCMVLLLLAFLLIVPVGLYLGLQARKMIVVSGGQHWFMAMV